MPKPPTSRGEDPTRPANPLDSPHGTGGVSAGGAVRTVVDAAPSSLSGDVSDEGHGGLATLPFTGFVFFGLALVGIAMLGVGAPLRRLTGVEGPRDSGTPQPK